MSEFNPEQPRGYREKSKPRSERRRELRGGGRPDDPSRRSFLKKFALGALAAVGFGVAGKLGLDKITEITALQESEAKTLKEKILVFDWESAQNPEKLRVFTEALADAYFKIAPSTRMTKTDLVGPDKTNFYKSKEDFVRAVKSVSPKQALEGHGIDVFGYAHYPTKQVFIDLAYIRRRLPSDPSLNQKTGLLLANTLFHEWGHLDLEERTIDNPKMSLDLSNGQKIEFKRYHGGMVVQDGTDVDRLFGKFDEVWNETLAVRRVYEALGRDSRVEQEYANIYYLNGLDIFLPFTADVPFETLYEMHATSDFEGFAKLIGRKLPGDQTELMKGMDLILAIDSADPSMIQKTGIFSVIQPPQR